MVGKVARGIKVNRISRIVYSIFVLWPRNPWLGAPGAVIGV